MPRFDVTIAGELNLDLILYGLPAELPPEREILADRMMLTLGGSSTIVAHNLAALGSRVGFISCVGDDVPSEIALHGLSVGGVDVGKVRRVVGGTKTGLTVILQRDGWRNMVTYAGTIFDLKFEDLDFGYLTDSRHFHFSSFYLQRGLKDRTAEIFQKIKAAGLTISLDTNDDPDDLWQGGLRECLGYVDIFLPNAREARQIAGTQDLQAALGLLANVVPLVVVKNGAEGAIAQRGGQTFSSPAVKVESVDAVGAGDSFDAGFLFEYLRGSDVAACLTMGNLAGAFSTTRAGGTEAFRDREYKDDFFRSHGAQLG
ncbi:MAG: carbohydrate kinase family protein [Candidatus Sulfotelmatobacter sp.]